MGSPPDAPSRDRLLDLVASFADQPIAVYADLVVDRFIRGTPKRISREAPVLILRQDGEDHIPGGGGNAIANVRALGGAPRPVGVVGDDENGENLLESFRGRGIDVGGISTLAGYLTPTKTRILAGAKHAIKQQIVRFDVEERPSIDDDQREQLRRALEDACNGADTLIVSDYGIGGVEPALLSATSADLTIADSRHRLPDFRGIEGATPNEEELDALEPGDPADAIARGFRLRKRLGTRFLLLTRGSSGMVLLDDAGATTIPVYGTDQVADVTGAGDTVIGTFALAAAAGATPLEAALLANYAGGIVVMKLGTATVSPQELATAIGAEAQLRQELVWVAS